MKELRPIVETGYENILLVRLLIEEVGWGVGNVRDGFSDRYDTQIEFRIIWRNMFAFFYNNTCIISRLKHPPNRGSAPPRCDGVTAARRCRQSAFCRNNYHGEP